MSAWAEGGGEEALPSLTRPQPLPFSLCLSQRRVNPGFQGQLKLYEAMGCAVDSSSALYKRYRLQMLRERYPGE